MDIVLGGHWRQAELLLCPWQRERKREKEREKERERESERESERERMVTSWTSCSECIGGRPYWLSGITPSGVYGQREAVKTVT